MSDAPAHHEQHTQRVIRSVVWAAWADALGFISELTDEKGLRRRLGGHGNDLQTPVAWTRRIGGRFGPDVELPAGCYSDDTQLRLAVGRAVTGAGFDVEAFARVELVMWPAYALGGGKATRAAAKNMTKTNVPWFGNFFPGWAEAGGNGVAMRVQPHVWAADPGGDTSYLRDVLIDGVVTHGHPRALFGAVLHAAALAKTLADGAVPGLQDWPRLLATAAQAGALIQDQPQLDSLWRPSWEAHTGQSFAPAWQTVASECDKLLTLAADMLQEPAASAPTADRETGARYARLVDHLELTNPAVRGSGTHTVVAALFLAAAAGSDVRRAAVLASRAVGTDTDTIATMSAAIAGAADGAEPIPDVLDRDYLVREAQRLSEIAAGSPTERFAYPDLLRWAPPRTQSDACGLAEGRVALAGLGWCEPAPGTQPIEHRDDRWQWMATDFGATVLLKQRDPLPKLAPGAWPVRRVVIDDPTRVIDEPTELITDRSPRTTRPTTAPARKQAPTSRRGARESDPALQETLDVAATVTDRPEPPLRVGNTSPPEQPSSGARQALDVDQMLDWVASHNFSEAALGYALRRIAESGSLEQIVAFSAAIHAAARHA